MKKIHHDIEFTVLRKKLKNTGSIEEKLGLLERLVSLQPRNPRNLVLRKKYREEMETLRLKKPSTKKSSVSPYEGIHYKRQVAIIGETNTGKSTLLNRLTGSDTPVSESPYTTYRPEVQMMDCRGVSVQVVEVPALFPGDADTAKYRFIRNAGVLCLCTENRDDFDSVIRQLAEYSVVPVSKSLPEEAKMQKSDTETVEKPAFIACRGQGIYPEGLDIVDINDADAVSELIYSLLNIKRIFLSLRGEVQVKPRVFPAEREVTVSDFINSLDKRLLKRFKRAKIVHSDPVVPDVQSAGLDYVLNDGDTVEIISY